MNFGFTEEQELLRAELRKFLDQNSPLEEVRKQVETPEGFSRPLWQRMAELGWTGLSIPEAHGGVGLGWVDLVVVLEETGRSLFPSPLIGNLLAARALELAGSAAQQAAHLPGLASGAKLATVALCGDAGRADPAAVGFSARAAAKGLVLDGELLLVVDAPSADFFVVAYRLAQNPAQIGLAWLDRTAPGVSVEPHVLMDTTRRMGRLRLDGAAAQPLGAGGDAWATVEHLLDCGAAAVCAEMIGAAEGALALTVKYAKERIQFDQPIGRFQAVKHPLAEMYVDVESFKSLCYYAAWLIDQRSPDAALAVSRAKAYASEAFARIGVDCVQLHGGVGYTWEYDIQLYLKRAKWSRPAFGDADFHYERVARRGGV